MQLESLIIDAQNDGEIVRVKGTDSGRTVATFWAVQAQQQKGIRDLIEYLNKSLSESAASYMKGRKSALNDLEEFLKEKV